MSDSTKDLKITVTTAADLSALKQTEDAFNRVSAAAKNSAATSRATLATIGPSIKDVRDAIKDLGSDFPMTAAALSLLVKRPLSALVLGIRMVEASYKNAMESIQQLGNRSTPEFEGLADAAQRRQTAFDKSDLDANSFTRALARLSKNRQFSDNREGTEANGSLNQSHSPLGSAASGTLREKMQTAKKAAGEAEFTAAKLAADESNLKKTQEKLRQLEDEHDEIPATTGWKQWFTLKPQYLSKAIKEQNETEQEANRNIESQLFKKISQDKTKSFTAADKARETQEDLAAFEDALLKNSTEERLPANQNTPGRRSAAFVNTLTPENLDSAGAAADSMSHGQKIDAGQRAMINSLASLLATTHSNSKDILQIIKDGHKDAEGLRREVAELRQAVSAVNSRAMLTPP